MNKGPVAPCHWHKWHCSVRNRSLPPTSSLRGRNLPKLRTGSQCPESLSQVSGLQLCSGDQDLSSRPGIPWPRSLLADSSPFGLRGLSWAVGVLALMDGVGTGNWQGGSWLGAPGLTDCIQQLVTALTENFSWHEKNRNLDSFQLYRFS